VQSQTQTNLLALNCSIEAARAAVMLVARLLLLPDEVRKLAGQKPQHRLQRCSEVVTQNSDL